MNKKEFEERFCSYQKWGDKAMLMLSDFMSAKEAWDWIEKYARFMQQKQNEACAETYHHSTIIVDIDNKIYNKIKNTTLVKE